MDPGTTAPMLPHFYRSEKLKQYLATISASMGSLCAGTVISWTSPALPFIKVHPNSTEELPFDAIEAVPGFRITEKEAALVGSMLTIGALISALPSGFLVDKIGRRLTLLSLSVMFLISWILIVCAWNVEMVIAGRFFAGIGLGGVCVTVPMYISEIAEVSLRGTLSSFFPAFLCTGILLSSVVGSFANWTWLSLILAIFPLIFGITFAFMPETPIYLIESSDHEEATKVLVQLRGQNCDVSNELREIEEEIEESKKNKASLKEVVTNKGNLRALISVVGVLSFQQLSGVSAVVFYTEPIFEAAGSNLSTNVASILINLVQAVITYGSVFFVEKANRKFFLMSSSVGMCLFLTALGMYIHLKILNVNVSHIGFIPLGACVLFIISFSIGYGPIPWMLMGELFSPEIKGVASGIAVLSNWICAFITTLCFPLINASLGGHVAFYWFAGIMALATIFVYFIVPETRGKSLVEIQEALNR